VSRLDSNWQTLGIVKQEALQVAVGARIVRLRKERRVTQEQLAAVAQMSRNALSDIELGKADIRLSTIRRIAEALKCTLAELMPDYPQT
jgi:XRE family aerobic/anaerobic benzoate catabolism transcriptional regulator